MELHNLITISTVPTKQLALQVYNHQVEIFTRLVTYLAVVSIIVWACVMATLLIRLGAQRHYSHSRNRLRKRL